MLAEQIVTDYICSVVTTFIVVPTPQRYYKILYYQRICYNFLYYFYML